MLLLPTLLLYALGLLLTGIGSRLASRCATWCGALCGLPMWMVGGTLVAVCTALPQLVLAFLAAGMSVTALAVGTALAGGVDGMEDIDAVDARRQAAAEQKEQTV